MLNFIYKFSTNVVTEFISNNYDYDIEKCLNGMHMDENFNTENDTPHTVNSILLYRELY